MAPPSRDSKPKFQAQDQNANRVHKRNQKNRDAPYPGGNARPQKHAVRPIKDRIRDVERMLKVAKMPANVRVGRERELAALYHDLLTTAAEKEKQKMIERYHMVRFFDRKKAERRLKKATKVLKDCEDPETRTRLEEELHVAQIDLNYTQYCPLSQAYSSLYPTKTGQDVKAHANNEKVGNGVRGNLEMWKEVEQATKDGKLEELRHRIDMDKIREMTIPHKSSLKSAIQLGDDRKQGKSTQGGVRLDAKLGHGSGDDSNGGVRIRAQDDDDDSDGGFFE